MTKSELEKSIDTLPFALPGGLLLGSESGTEYFLSTNPPAPGLWTQVRENHSRSGLWPVFLRGHESDPERPWIDEDQGYAGSRPPDDCDPEVELGRLWNELAECNSAIPRLWADFRNRTGPFDGRWPGLAAAAVPELAPEAAADALADRLIIDTGTRLGLVPVNRSADVPAVTQWWPGDEMDIAAAIAVLRSWEERFGVRMVQFGYDSLELSVAAPPRTLADAERVAAEHFALCVENIGRGSGDLSLYAEELIGARHWSFWWSRDVPDWFDDDDG